MKTGTFAGQDHEWLLVGKSAYSFSPNTVANPHWTMTVRWGDSGTGITLAASSSVTPPGTPSSTVTVTTPWGNVTVPALGTLYLDYWWGRLRMTNGKLTVNADCTWSLTFDALDFYFFLDSGPEQHFNIVSTTTTVSGSGYDARWNGFSFAVSFDPSVTEPTSWTSANCFDPNIPVATTQTGYTNIGTGNGPDGSPESGYRWGAPGSWSTDPETFDTNSAPAGCACLESLPSVTGSDSFHIQMEADFSNVITVGPTLTVDCPCTGGGHIHYTYVAYSQTWQTTNASVFVVPDTTAMGRTQFYQSSNCNGTLTTSTSTSTPSPSVCSSDRIVNAVTQTMTCAGGRNDLCLGGLSDPTCNPGRPVVYCIYRGEALVTWLTAPPCGSVSALDCDMALHLRRACCWADAATGHIFLGFANNVTPQALSSVDTGIAATDAAIRWLKTRPSTTLAMLYASAANLLQLTTPDEGLSFTGTVTITSSLSNGGGFDFVIDRAGVRHYYWEQGASGARTVYYAAYDAQGNLIRGPVATNITNADLGSLAIDRGTSTGGVYRIDLLYTISGVLTSVSSQNGDLTTFA